MDNNKDHIVLLIAYQRKALRLLNLGLSNENVVHLLNQRPEQKKDLLNIKPLLEGSLNKNVMRNTEIYKKQCKYFIMQKSQKIKCPCPSKPQKNTWHPQSNPKKLPFSTRAKALLHS